MSDYDLRRLGGRKPKSAEERFAESYLPEPNSGCWLWLGSERGSNGYGRIKAFGKVMPAHRYSWAKPHGLGRNAAEHADVPRQASGKSL